MCQYMRIDTYMHTCTRVLKQTGINRNTCEHTYVGRKLISALSHQLKAPLLGVVSLGQNVLDDCEETDVHVSCMCRRVHVRLVRGAISKHACIA
jgi:hypothetical protein